MIYRFVADLMIEAEDFGDAKRRVLETLQENLAPEIAVDSVATGWGAMGEVGNSTWEIFPASEPYLGWAGYRLPEAIDS